MRPAIGGTPRDALLATTDSTFRDYKFNHFFAAAPLPLTPKAGKSRRRRERESFSVSLRKRCAVTFSAALRKRCAVTNPGVRIRVL